MTDQLLPTPQEIIANQVANQANSVTGIYGISGAGKSSLADTGAEYTAQTFGKITLCYAADLGGFGNKRLTLIRAGLMRVYDPRNHINPFETMELISLGAWPIELIDPERGFAAPDVPLILPRRVVYQQYCPQGHATRRFDAVAVMTASATPCPTCGTVTTVMNASKVDKLIVRHRMFEQVGHRIYDSMSALNDWGLQDLQKQSAEGTLPKTSSGGSLLGSADALVSGIMRFGSSSEGQYGFVQNRTYGWLSNIRAIPDHVVPPTATFFVEISKEKKGGMGGGDIHYGPKIAGNAKTGEIGGWLGNCLHATREPLSETDPRMVHRLWLRNHIDPRDPARLPYIAKHRGTPLDMPDYLEDAPGAEPWSQCSLAVFFGKLQAQLTKLDQQTREKYPHAAGMWRGDQLTAEAEDVVSGIVPPMNVPQVQMGASAPAPTATSGGGGVTTISATAAPPASPEAQATVTTGGPRRRRVATMPAPAPAAQAAPAAPVASSVSTVPDPASPTAADLSPAAAAAPEGATTASPAPSVIQQQLEATLAVAAAADQTAGAGATASAQEPGATPPTPSSAPLPPSAPVPAPTPTAPPIAPTTTAVAGSPVQTSTRFRRAARPPV